MGVDLCTYRARIGCFRNPAFVPLCCWQSCLLVWMVISQLMLKLAGDVEENPGPRQQNIRNITMATPLRLREQIKPTQCKIMRKWTTLLTLDLSDRRLSQLPDELYELSEVEALKLDRNKGIELSDKLCELTNLKLLSLNNCNLATVPAVVAKLHQLEVLYLSNNKNIILTDNMCSLVNLTVLSLADCDLKSVPAVVGKLSQLKALYLCNNNNITLSDEMSSLANLIYLNLHNCDLDMFPSVVLKLSHLQQLDLSDNQVSLPNEMSSLVNLIYLKLHNCDLDMFPPVVLKLSKLEELDLSNNRISLPDELYKLGNIKVLRLPNCNLVTIPPVVLKLTWLEELDLSWNRGIRLPDELSGLTNIRILKLRGTAINTVPPVVWRLTQLEWLDLSYNTLKTLPADIEQLTNMKQLDLQKCQLCTLPEVWRLTQLERLDLKSNPLQTLPPEMGKLTNMKHLYLSDCHLRTLPAEVGRLTQVEWLDLSFNPIQTIPEEIGQLTNMKHLNLSDCELHTLPPEVGALRQLDWLKLSFNSLQSLPVEIALLSNVSRLDVRRNPLIKPPAEVCRRGIIAIRQYFDELKRSEENISAHLKVVVLGKTMAGKTSLVQTLSIGKSALTEEEDRTHCVEITQWAPGDNITFEVYDFGGHDVYHLTHQFFLTQGALNLLTVNLHEYKCTQQCYTEAVGFWLDTLNVRVPGAVVTVVCSKTDLCSSTEIDQKTSDIEQRFKQQLDTLQQSTKQQMKKLKDVLDKRRAKNEDDQSQRETEKQFERTCRLLERPLRLIGMYRVSSVEPTTGLDTLRSHILESVNDTSLFPTLRKILPRSWVKFEQQLNELRLKGTEIRDSRNNPRYGSDDYETDGGNLSADDCDSPSLWVTVADCLKQGQRAGLSPDRLEPVLSYLQQVGTILRYTDIPELKDFVFYDPPVLVEILKDMFHHDVKELFNTPELPFTSAELDGFKQDLHNCGLIRKDVMTCLLPPNINPDIVTALMQHFGLCFETQVKDKADPSKRICKYQIPWYLRKQMPNELKSVWPEDLPEGLEQLQLVCDIRGFCPWGLFQRFSVRIDPLVKDRVDWKHGTMAYKQDYPIMVCSKLLSDVKDDTRITIATRGRLALADEMWGVVQPVMEILVQLLKEWKGVLYSLHVTCAHCIKAGLDRPFQHELRDRTADDGRNVRCPRVMHTASTSADLVYRPGRLPDAWRESFCKRPVPSQHKNDYYKMTSDPRGLALIIININFENSKSSRHKEADKDMENIRKICEKLKLQQKIRENLTAQEIEAATKEVSERDHSNYDCFVLFLLSHGSEDGVSGIRGQHISVDKITPSFQACKSLVGKPKLFFIQACRGVDMDKGQKQSDTTTGKSCSISQARTEASDETGRITESPTPPTTALDNTSVWSTDASTKGASPTASDRLVMYATVYGHVAWKDGNTGSLLIKVLADVIAEHAETEELVDMLRRVNAKVADFNIKGNKYKQQPEMTITLRKKLYFFPETALDLLSLNFSNLQCN